MNSIEMNEPIMSIYIPRIRQYFTEKNLAQIIQYYYIGVVHSIDFIPLNKKHGFYEDYEGEFKAAFIHVLKDSISEEAMQTFWKNLEENKVHKIPVNNGDYLLCLKAHNPVKRTTMNIHQVVENGRYLEDLVARQQEELTQMKEYIQRQNEELQGLKNVVYQFVGGLYCQEKQRDIIDVHLAELGFSNNQFKNSENTHRFNTWPTTRQGDENTKRIEVLEGIIHKMFDFKKSCYESDDEEQYHQIHPSDQDHTVDQETRSNHSDNSERMKNSYDLCGNA